MGSLLQNSRILFNPRVIAVMTLIATLAFTFVYPSTEQNVAAQTTVDICDRTDQIEEAILRNIQPRPDCGEVTAAQLAAITTIDVSGDQDGTGSVVTSLKSGDLSGLTGLKSFAAANSRIGSIPSGFFSENSGLTTIDLSIAQLMTDQNADPPMEALPDTIFDHLTSLGTLRLERNYFKTMPAGLDATSMAKLTNLRELTLGMDWPNHWHLQELPSGWITNLPDDIGHLKLGHIRLSSADADHIIANFGSLTRFTFDYQALSFEKFTDLMTKLKTNSTTTPMSSLRLTSSGDGLESCATQSANAKSLGTWYSENPNQIEAFKTALSGLKVGDLTIIDPTMTPTVLEDILSSIDKGTPNKIQIQCGQLAGFAGNALPGYTSLNRLEISYSNLTLDDFKSIVVNLSDTPIYQLVLERNYFDKDDSFINLTEFDFSGILDTLGSLSFIPYSSSCEGPWVDDYHAAGINLTNFPKTFVFPETPTGPVSVRPQPTHEPEECKEPVEPEIELQVVEEETNHIEPNWPPARIMSIEPAVTAIRIWTGKQVVLTTEVYGVQGILDNDLADAESPDDVWFDWVDNTRSADFTESIDRPIRINNEPDDREVLYQVPTIAGNYRVSVNVPFAARCKGPRAEIDETMEEAIARCTAEFDLIVRYPRDIHQELTPPVNPTGTIPSSVSNDLGTSCPVFTPEEGGAHDTPSYSIAADPGAVQNNTAVAICVEKSGPASNAGMTEHRYTLHGDLYSITAFDLDGQRMSEYDFNFPIEACIPLPDELRNRLSDVDLTVINRDSSLTVLQSTTVFSQGGIRACGYLGALHATVAVGAKGVPPSAPAEILPDTGPGAPSLPRAILALVLGIVVIIFSLKGARNNRQRGKRSSR